MIERWMELSLSVISFLQTNFEWLVPVMEFFTFLGNEEFYLLIMPVLLWSIDYAMGLRLGVMLMLSGSLNTFLKFGFHQPRPYWVSAEIENLTSPMGSFGLPSGHSQNAASVFGLLVGLTKRKWLKGLLIFTIVMIAFSRLFLGVHSIQDILLGLLVGTMLLWIFLKLEQRLVVFYRGKKPWLRVGIAFLISVVLTSAGFLIVYLHSEFQLPTVWVNNAHMAHPQVEITPLSMDGLVTTTATLFGLIVGGIWVRETGGYKANKGNFLQHVLRFLLGLAGVLMLWQGLGKVFPRTEDILGYCLRYIRYALVGLWISAIAPIIFMRLGLAVGKEESI